MPCGPVDVPETLNGDTPPSDDSWDAGAMGCGEIVMMLRRKLKAMPGGTLLLIARDPGVPEDLPAYCRMTRNELLHADPATHRFWIRSRFDWS